MKAAEKPLVSVVIPAYNRAATIGRTLDTIVAQSGWPVEIVVVDDGSSDDTAAVARRHAPTARVIVQANQRRSAARNNGARLAAGEFLYFFDSDDLMEPGAVARLAGALHADPQAAVAYGRALVFHDDPARAVPRLPFCDTGGDLFRQQLDQPFLIPDMTMVRRSWFERVGGMTTRLDAAEDYHFFLKICALGGRYRCVGPEPVVRYREYRTVRTPPSHQLHGYWLALSMVAEDYGGDLPASVGLSRYVEQARLTYVGQKRCEREPLRTYYRLVNLPRRVWNAGRRLLTPRPETRGDR
jgi:glycosyltransferase involved in cell wall biosynthesis